MTGTWVLSQFYANTENGFTWPVAANYCNGHEAPSHPDNALDGGWGLVLCNQLNVEAAAQDPRVQPYATVWDVLTPETVTAYQSRGATAGMMLCQLLSLLAQKEPGYRHS